MLFVLKSTYDAMKAEANACSQIAIATATHLTKIAGERDNERTTVGTLRLEIESLREAAYGADRTAAMYKKLYEGTTKALGEIVAQETATANATVKRMARIARAELPVLHHDAAAAGHPTANGAAVQGAV